MITHCRSCGSRNIVPVLDLQGQYLSDFVDKTYDMRLYGLSLVLCTECTLVQLRESTPPKVLYTENYGYRSGINGTIRADLKDVVDKATKLVQLEEGDIVCDIGSNDFYLLNNYPKNVVRIGIDPIKKWEKYKEDNIFINDFFNHEAYQEVVGDKKAKIITIISCFYDIEEPNKFVADLVKILDDDGIIIIEQNYLATMLQNVAFDNIVHEHIEYYSLKSLEHLLSRHGLEVFDVEINSINGGAFRVYVRHMDNVKKLRQMEEKLKLGNKWTYMLFAIKVKQIKDKVYNFIKEKTDEGKTVYLYGASTRGNSLIQACGLNNKLIKAAVERNPEKWGKRIASLDIPIISEEQARKEKPDYALLLPWFFSKEIIARDVDLMKQGMKFIVPLPEFKIIDYENYRSHA